MRVSEHTPGPWMHDALIIYESEGGRSVAMVSMTVGTQDLANARPHRRRAGTAG